MKTVLTRQAPILKFQLILGYMQYVRIHIIVIDFIQKFQCIFKFKERSILEINQAAHHLNSSSIRRLQVQIRNARTNNKTMMYNTTGLCKPHYKELCRVWRSPRLNKHIQAMSEFKLLISATLPTLLSWRNRLKLYIIKLPTMKWLQKALPLWKNTQPVESTPSLLEAHPLVLP